MVRQVCRTNNCLTPKQSPIDLEHIFSSFEKQWEGVNSQDIQRDKPLCNDGSGVRPACAAMLEGGISLAAGKVPHRMPPAHYNS
jgi:hypothetical protein